jgi:hypothetical protein
VAVIQADCSMKQQQQQQQQQAAASSSKQHQAAASSSNQQQAAASSSKQQQAAAAAASSGSSRQGKNAVAVSNEVGQMVNFWIFVNRKSVGTLTKIFFAELWMKKLKIHRLFSCE